MEMELKNLKLIISIVIINFLLANCASTGGGFFSKETKIEVIQRAGQVKPLNNPLKTKTVLNILQKNQNPKDVIYSHIYTGEWQTAQKMSRAFLANNPGDKDILKALAVSLAMEKKYKLAFYYANMAVSKGDSMSLNFQGLSILNDVNSKIFEYKNSIRLFKKAFEMDGKDISSGLNLAYILLETGNAPASKIIFNRIKKRCNNCLESLKGLGIIEYSNLQFKEASDYFNQALSKNPYDAESMFYLALIYKNHNKNYNKAIKLLNNIISSTNKMNWHRKAKNLYKIIKNKI